MVVALVIALIALGFSHLYIVRPVPIAPPQSTSSPAPPPHFALDDLDLGPAIRLTRFYPDFDLYPGRALEGADGNLYVAYYPNRPPDAWGFTGGEPSRLGILDGGKLTPLFLTKDDVAKSMNPGRIEIQGLENGQPVISINDGPTSQYMLVTGGSAQPLPDLPKTLKKSGPCIDFAGGTICEDSSTKGSAVRITLPNREPVLVVGASYPIDRSTVSNMGLPLKWQTSEIGDVWLEGGGHDRFLLVEYHPGQGAAECLEGFAP
jgi:hypothetical protein